MQEIVKHVVIYCEYNRCLAELHVHRSIINVTFK